MFVGSKNVTTRQICEKPMAELMESFYSTEWVSNNMGLLSTPQGSTGTDSC